MAIDVMNRVWKESKQKGSDLLLLLSIADYCNDDGIAWPSIQNLAKKSRMSERQTQRNINALAERGELYVEKIPGRTNSNRYFIITALTPNQIYPILKTVFKLSEQECLSIIAKTQIKGDKMTPFINGDISGKKGVTTMTPFKGEKGDTSTEEKVTFSKIKGDIFDIKGDIAMSPDPMIRHEEIHHEEKEKEGISHSFNATPLFDKKVFASDNQEEEEKEKEAEQTLLEQFPSLRSTQAHQPEKPKEAAPYPASPTKKPKKQKADKPDDPNEIKADHPAIAAMRDIIGRYPSKLTWPEIVEILGENPDIVYLRKCATEWGKKSGNMGNFSVWLCEWYKSGLPLGLHQGSASSSSQAQTQAPIQQQVKRKPTREESDLEVLRLLQLEEQEKQNYERL